MRGLIFMLYYRNRSTDRKDELDEIDFDHNDLNIMLQGITCLAMLEWQRKSAFYRNINDANANRFFQGLSYIFSCVCVVISDGLPPRTEQKR